MEWSASNRTRPNGGTRIVSLAVGVCLAISLVPVASGGSHPGTCLPPTTNFHSVRIADELLQSRYTFHPHTTVRLPRNPTWGENPFKDRNWEFQYHSLRWAWNLAKAYETTGETAYLERLRFLLRDWAADNPWKRSPSKLAWNHHAAAWRSIVLACAKALFPRDSWLDRALRNHGTVLTWDSFYARDGNHALNQNQGLLAIGCATRRHDWIALATKRTSELIERSIDRWGVNNEQAIDYQYYNFVRYSEMRARMEACHITVPDSFDRVTLMPDVLAHATLPNGEYELLGDTGRHAAYAIPDTTAAYAASQGASGVQPAGPSAVYVGGYAFGRTAWGVGPEAADERHWSMRFGPGIRYHGHADGTAVTLYGYGTRLLLDSGKYKYEQNPWREWFKSPVAHNVVVPLSTTFDRRKPATLLSFESSSALDHVLVHSTAYRGVVNDRRVIFSRSMGYLVVEDRLRASVSKTYRQLWHLPEDAAPRIEDGILRTNRERGNVAIVQLVDTRTHVVRGSVAPKQGWLSYLYGQRIPAPTVQSWQRGNEVRFLTLLLPYPERDTVVEASEINVTRDGFSVVIRIGDRSELVTVNDGHATITDVGGAPLIPLPI